MTNLEEYAGYFGNEQIQLRYKRGMTSSTAKSIAMTFMEET
jgi:hypothetical protein